MSRTGPIVAVLAILAGCAAPRQPTPQVPAPADVPARAETPQAPTQQEAPLERLRGPYSTAQGWALCGESATKALRVTPAARSVLEPFAAQGPALRGTV